MFVYIFFVALLKVFPKQSELDRPLTRLQERLKKKLGDNAFPFWFEIPSNSASSVTLQVNKFFILIMN